MTAPTGFARSPRMLRAGLARIVEPTRTLTEVITFQYNPDTVTRTLQPRAVGNEPGDRLEMTRFTGPPHETIKFDAELDAVDHLEHPDDNDNTARHGLLPALARFEMLLSPAVSDLVSTDNLFESGQLEVLPGQAPLTVLVWSPDRVVPVQLTGLTVAEEVFDTSLHPIRVKLSIECKVLTTNDLNAGTLGYSMYLAYRRGLERLAAATHNADPRSPRPAEAAVNEVET